MPTPRLRRGPRDKRRETREEDAHPERMWIRPAAETPRRAWHDPVPLGWPNCLFLCGRAAVDTLGTAELGAAHKAGQTIPRGLANVVERGRGEKQTAFAKTRSERSEPYASFSGGVHLKVRARGLLSSVRAGIPARRKSLSVPIRAGPGPKVSTRRTPFCGRRLGRSGDHGGLHRAQDAAGDASPLSLPVFRQGTAFLRTWSRAVSPRVGRHVICLP